MQAVRLTPTSYIVLGLLQFAGESTPYRLKQLVAGSVGYFWTLQHAQLGLDAAEDPHRRGTLTACSTSAQD